jgi:membrane protein
MNPKSLFNLLKGTFKAWSEDKAARLGAALAYYTIFSIGPLLLVIVAIAGLVFGQQAAEGRIVGAIGSVVGEQGAQFLQSVIQNAAKPTTGIISTVIGVLILLLGASAIFGQLKDALNTIWGIMLKPSRGILAMLTERVLTFGMVLAIGFLLIVSLGVSAVLSVLGSTLGDNLPGGALLWQIVNFLITLGVMTLLFATIYKVLPDAKIAWKDVWLGAAVTSVLFILGQIALSFYLGFANVGSAYGAAGALVVLLVWIYYSAQIFLFGAEFAQVYANASGSPIVPEDYAELVSPQARAEQGLRPKEMRKRQRSGEEERRKSPWFKWDAA